MSSDSQPSFHLSVKNKFQKLVSSNKTSLVRERLISNETYVALSEKSRNLTNKVLDKTGLDIVINKIESFLPWNAFSDQNATAPKGFFDSLFSPQTANDVYLKAAIICLWTVAIFCVLATMITMFVSIGSKNKKNSVTRWVFFHIFLCELCYLIYILLSMINVGMDFKLNSFWCDIGKYFMYATVPVMYLVLVILFFERLVTYCGINTSAVGKLKSTVFIQILIGFIWILSIVLISIVVYFKNQAKHTFRNKTDKILPKNVKFFLQEMFFPDQCFIDGQLLPFFKILFLVLLIIIIILFLKSMAFSFVYAIVPSLFPEHKASTDKDDDNHMTLIFIIIIFFNLVLSFPFYFISTANSIVDTFRGDQSFTMKLKISFILRLVSIILQCFIFYILENGCWNILQKVMGFILCQKKTGNGRQRVDKVRSRPEKQSSRNNRTEASPQPTNDDSDHSLTDDEDLNQPIKSPPATQQTQVTDNDEDTDKEDDVPQKPLLKHTPSVKEKTVTKETISKSTETKNSSKKTTSNGTVTTPPKPTIPVDQKPSKSSKIEKNPRTEPINISNASSGDDEVFIVDEKSPTKIPPTIVESNSPPLPRPPHPRMYSPRRHRGHQRHWTTKARFSRTISTQPRYTQLPTDQNKSTEPSNTHVKKHHALNRVHSTPV